MFEPVWFVQHANVDSDDVSKDSRIVVFCNINEDSDNAYDD